ncbi:DUF421 domain-containing protein [Paenisporosarcina indica]|uniref:DUF421 domain-containing protein n=1 Tax=Paenisporosarcina indica TaxID=650093 RepID=UPI00094F8416|nr:DUF421 domain-containing protein [Paenisporosarcina indica]
MVFVEIGLKIIVGLAALLAVTRLLGKKEMSQLTPFDFIYALVLGGILEEGIYDPKITIWQILFGVVVWGILIYLIELFTLKFDVVRILLKGEPALLVRDGQFNMKEMKRNKLEMEQFRTMLRQRGFFTLREVKDVYLEPGGQISVLAYSQYEAVTREDVPVEKEDEPLTFLLVDNGKINKHVLKNIDKTEDWLTESLREEGYPQLHDIVYAEWSGIRGFFIKTHKK